MDGLAATLAAIAFAFFAIDAVTVHPSDAVLALALAGALACAGFLPFNLRPHGKALVFMGDSGSQVLGFALAALGLVGELEASRGRRSRRSCCRSSCSPCRSSTRRSSRSCGCSKDGRSTRAAATTRSHRLVRFGLSEKHAVLLLALIATALGGDEPRLQRARRPAARARRRARHVRRCSCSSRASSPTSSAASRRRGDRARCRRSRCTGAGSSRCSSTSCRDHRRVRGGVRDRVRLAGNGQPAAHRAS